MSVIVPASPVRSFRFNPALVGPLSSLFHPIWSLALFAPALTINIFRQCGHTAPRAPLAITVWRGNAVQRGHDDRAKVFDPNRSPADIPRSDGSR